MKKTTEMLTKDEFKVLVMLYAANIDSNIHHDEVDEILQRTDAITFEKMKKVFQKMSDAEILSCINDNKARYCANEENKKQLLDDVHTIIAADEHHSAMEAHLIRVLKKALE